MKCQSNVEIAGSPRNVLRYSHHTPLLVVERWMGSGPIAGYQPQPNCEGQEHQVVRETAGAKLRRQKGNSPDHQLRSPTTAQCARRFARPDSQEVGLEAAILQRVRNSSLVECAGTDNVARLKPLTEAVDAFLVWEGMVGERSGGREA